MSASQRLSTRDSLFRLYDSQELLNMDSKVASGYVVLMGGYHSTAETSATATLPTATLDKGAINLAFMALTSGNVVDACFGVKTHMSRTDGRTSRVVRAAKNSDDAKTMLNDAVRSSNAVKEIAVSAYGQAFQVTIQYNDDMKGLNFITRCYRWKPIHRKAEDALFEAFKSLNEAIAAAS